MNFSDAKAMWDRRYAGADGFLFGREPNEWLVRQANRLPPGADILCVADGEGRNSTWLAARGHQVTAFDISPVAVEKLQAFASERAVAVQASVSSVSDWPWQEENHDVVVAVFVQFADPDLRSWLFKQMAQSLRPGGLLLIEGYGLRQMDYRTGGPGIAEHLYTLPLLESAFDGWQRLDARDEDATISEGSAHVGQSHLVSLLVRKPGA